MKVGTLFSCGGGIDAGIKDAGHELVFAVEIDPRAAAIYRENLGDHVIEKDVLDVLPSELADVDWLIGCPPCVNFSPAGNLKPDSEDMKFVVKMISILKEKKPTYFTLENVWNYRNSEEFVQLINLLEGIGYHVHYEKVNFADYGVPQTRERLILIACLNGKVSLPKKTHTKKKQDTQMSIFDDVPVDWVGWYESMQDLVYMFPDDELSNWQVKKLKKNGIILGDDIVGDILNFAVRAPESGKGKMAYATDEPYHTLRAQRAIASRAVFALQSANTSSERFIYEEDEPLSTLRAKRSDPHKAVLVEYRVGGNRPPQLVDGERTAFTLSTGSGGNVIKAVVCDAGNTKSNGQIKHRNDDQPMKTITVGDLSHKAVLFEQKPRYKIVRLTPRALARIQTFPDWYKLPSYDEPVKRKIVKYLGNDYTAEQLSKLMEDDLIREYLHNKETMCSFIIGNAVPSRFGYILAKHLESL